MGLPLLLVVQENPDLVVTVTRISTFAPITLSSFALVYDNITSTELSSGSTAEEVKTLVPKLLNESKLDVKLDKVPIILTNYVLTLTP